MKKKSCFTMAALLMMALCGCSNDDGNNLTNDKAGDSITEKDDLSGIWELEHCYNPENSGGDHSQFTINEDESIVEFKDGKTIIVKSKSTTYFDKYFLPTGQYSYTLGTSSERFPGAVLITTIEVIKTEEDMDNRIIFNGCVFQRDDNKLMCFVYVADQSHYPFLEITYTFHQKKI